MFTLLLVIMTLLAIGLIVIILLQAGKGGGLSSTFGGASSSADQVMGSRQAANFLERTTWIGGGVFLFLGLVLSIMTTASRSGEGGSSILQGEIQGEGNIPSNPTSVLQQEGRPTSDTTQGTLQGLVPPEDTTPSSPDAP